MTINFTKMPEGQGAVRTTGEVKSNKKSTVTVQNTAAGTTVSISTDRVQISGRGRELTEMLTSSDKTTDEREQRVAELKQQVESGSYTVDASKVAGAILKSI